MENASVRFLFTSSVEFSSTIGKNLNGTMDDKGRKEREREPGNELGQLFARVTLEKEKKTL